WPPRLYSRRRTRGRPRRHAVRATRLKIPERQREASAVAHRECTVASARFDVLRFRRLDGGNDGGGAKSKRGVDKRTCLPYSSPPLKRRGRQAGPAG